VTGSTGSGGGETHRTRGGAADDSDDGRNASPEETSRSDEVTLQGVPPSARSQASEGTDDTSAYSSRRKRSGSRLRWAAIAGSVAGCGLVGFTLLNLYVPATSNPVSLRVDPVISLSALGSGGGVLVLFSLLVYAYARRAGI